MIKAIGFAVALMALAPVVPAQAYPISSSFTHEASGYVVQSRSFAGYIMLNGKHPTTGATFKVRVAPTGKVTGTWDGQPVEFVMNGDAGDVQFASGVQQMDGAR